MAAVMRRKRGGREREEKIFRKREKEREKERERERETEDREIFERFEEVVGVFALL